LEETEEIKIQRGYVYTMVRLQVDRGRGSDVFLDDENHAEGKSEGPQRVI
jgi:hypothetical protein